MKIALALLLLLLPASLSFGQNGRYFYKDKSGRTTGSRYTNDRLTTYYDKVGRTTGTRTDYGIYSFYKNKYGKTIGSRTNVK